MKLIIAPSLTLGSKIAANIYEADHYIFYENDYEGLSYVSKKYDWIGISWNAENTVLNIIDFLKKNTKAKLFCGGYSATLFKKYLNGVTPIEGYVDNINNYDYTNNFLIAGNTYITETSRGCPMKIKCSFCAQRPGYTKLDIDKICSRIQKTKKSNIEFITLADSEVPPDHLNKLKKFGSIHCFIDPKHFKFLDSNLKDCLLFTGLDCFHSPNHNYNIWNKNKTVTDEEYQLITTFSHKNSIDLSQVIINKSDIDYDFFIKESIKFPNMRFCFNTYIDYKNYNPNKLKNEVYNTIFIYHGKVYTKEPGEVHF